MFNIANNLERNDFPDDFPFQSRFDYLNNLTQYQIEEVRKINNNFINIDPLILQDNITSYEINFLGKPYTYQLRLKQTMHDYLVKAIEVINRTQD